MVASKLAASQLAFSTEDTGGRKRRDEEESGMRRREEPLRLGGEGGGTNRTHTAAPCSPRGSACGADKYHSRLATWQRIVQFGSSRGHAGQKDKDANPSPPRPPQGMTGRRGGGEEVEEYSELENMKT